MQCRPLCWPILVETVNTTDLSLFGVMLMLLRILPTHKIGMHWQNTALTITQVFAVDLQSLCWGKKTVPCLRLETHVFLLKLHWAKVQSCFVRVR
jgi:hypothetical protein